MWTSEHRRFAARKGLRYPSDLTDGEWALIEPMIPPAKRGGRRRKLNIREVLNAIFYVLSTGCQWQALPKDLPPKSTAHSDFMRGIGTARWSASIMRFTLPRGSAKGGRRGPPMPSSIAGPPRPLNRSYEGGPRPGPRLRMTPRTLSGGDQCDK